MVFLKSRQRSVNLLFGFYIIALIIWILSNLFADAFIDPQVTLFWTKMGIVGPLLVGPIFLHFSYIFPSGKSTVNKTIILWMLPLFTILLTPTNLNIKAISIENWGTDYQPGPLYIFSSILIFSYIWWGSINLIKKMKSTPSHIRAQLLLISVSSIITLGIAIITAAILPLYGNSRFAILAPCSTLILFGAITYAIVKHKFLDINYLIFRAISFTLVAATVGLFYALFLFNGLILFPQNYQAHASITAALLLAFTYPAIKRLIEALTKNIFYRQPYSSRTLLERLGELLRSTLSLHTLLRGVVSEIEVTIKPASAWFVIISDHDLNSKYEKIGYGQDIKVTPNTLFNLNKICQDESVLVRDEIEQSLKKDLLAQFKIAILMPLRVKGDVLGFLALGDKASGNIYSNQDLELLEILAPQLSVAVQNALSYEEINQFNQTLKQEVDKATTDLKKANQELKHLDKLKDEFVFVATHELKNPVTAMRGYLSMFQEGIFGDIPEKMREPINQLQASNQQLVELVNDLLQIARSEAQTLSIKTEPINLCPTIDSVIQNLKPLASQKGLEMIHQCPNSIPQVIADNQRVREILNNLLSNAIKYSDKGTITLSHQLKTDQIITHIADQGVGISLADQKRLFTRFFRVEEEAAKGIPGTGLGLFIVKQLIEKMGGQIWVNSEKGHGTTFSFSLPTA
jgi:signal transduction histidine kinase